jgi:hypothetical protein
MKKRKKDYKRIKNHKAIFIEEEGAYNSTKVIFTLIPHLHSLDLKTTIRQPTKSETPI